MTIEDMFTCSVHKSLLSGESWFCINLESQSKLFLIIEKKGCHTSSGVLNLEMFMLFQFLILYLCNLLPSGKNLPKWIEAPLHKKTLQALNNLIWDGISNIYADNDEATMPTMMTMIFCNYIQQANSPSGLSQDLKQKGMTRLRITEPWSPSLVTQYPQHLVSSIIIIFIGTIIRPIGSGKITVEFFSALMLFSVWKISLTFSLTFH